MKGMIRNKLLAIFLAVSMFTVSTISYVPAASDEVTETAAEQDTEGGESVSVEIPESNDDFDLSDLSLDGTIDSDSFINSVSSGNMPDEPVSDELPDISMGSAENVILEDLDLDLGETETDTESDTDNSEITEDLSVDAENPIEEEGEESETIPSLIDEGVVEDGVETTAEMEPAGDDLELGASEPSVILSTSYLSIRKGSSYRVTVSYTGISGSIYLSYNLANSRCSARWDSQWSNHKIGLTLSGIEKGTNIVTIFMKDSVTNRVLASRSITVVVSADPDYRLSLSSSSVTLQVDQSINITASCSGHDVPVYMSFALSGSQYTTARWQSVTERAGLYSAPLRITGLKGGQSVYTIRMHRRSDSAVLKSVTLVVTVLPKPYLQVSSSATVNLGKSVSLDVTAGNYIGRFYFNFQASNSNAEAYWSGGWKNNGTTHALKITGKKAGRTDFSIRMFNASNGSLLATTTLTVTVREPNAVLRASSTSVKLKAGQESTITLTASNITTPCEISYTKVGSSANAAFGSSSGLSVPFRISGIREGSTVFYLYLKRASDKSILATASVTVNVEASVTLKASCSSLTVQKDSSARIVFTYAGTGESVRLNCRMSNHVKASWDAKWSGTSLGLTVSGVSAGSGKLEVSLIRDSDRMLLATVTVPVTVKEPKTTISATPSSFELAQSGSRTVSISYNNPPAGSMLTAKSSKAGVVELAFTDKYGKKLKVTALGSGSTSILLYISDKNGKIIYAATSIKVTVTGKSVSSVSYDICNTHLNSWGGHPGFNYPKGYRIPENIYKYMFGNTSFAHDLYTEHTGWGGNCYGMSMTAMLLYHSAGTTIQKFNSGAKRALDLYRTDRNAQINLNLTQYIEAMQISQYSNAVWDMLRDGNLNAIVREVSSGNMVVICFWGWFGEYDRYGKKEEGGHAVLAYSADTSGKKYNYLNVYDPNHPNENQRIELTKNSSGTYTSWKYHFGEYPCGTGYLFNGLKYNTLDDAVKIWNSKGRITDRSMNRLIANTNNFKIFDVEDNCVEEVIDGVLHTDREQIYRPVYMDAPVSDSYELCLPTRYYRIVNSDPDVDELQISMVNVDLAAEVITTGNEIDFVVEDENNLNQVLMTPEEGQAYQITLSSTLEGNPQNVQINGIGNGTQLEVSVEDGVLNTNGTIDGMVNVDGVIEDGHLIQAVAGKGGTIFPSGEVPVADGSSQTFMIKPAADYSIESIKVDGVEIPVADSYQFKEITDNHSIEVSFVHNHVSDSGEVTTPSTCKEKGVKTYCCSGCNEVLKTEELPLTDHTWGAWEVTKEATVFATGVKQRVCEVCGKKQSKTVGKCTPYIKLNIKSNLSIEKTIAKKVIVWMAKGDYITGVKTSNDAVVKIKVINKNNAVAVTARKKTGKATITITTKTGQTISANITVPKAKTRKIDVPSSVKVKKGKTLNLAPKKVPDYSDDGFKFVSANNKVATVTAKGIIKGINSGKVNIAIRSGDIVKKVKVTVY